MRQGQQNRRGRGRSNNNNNTNNRGGKGHNPLTRTVESNGPDVKIRGNPSHIAEKYITLARDSLSSGDIVMAENYLQHAEHYNRIIMAHREQLQSQQDASSNRQTNRHNNSNSNSNNNNNRNNAEPQAANEAQAGDGNSVAIRGSEPQPRISEPRSREPREAGRTRRNAGENRGERQARAPRVKRDNSDAANGETTRAASTPRRRNTSTNTGNGGPKISDGQDTPGFLRNSVAPAAKRRRRAPATEAANGDSEDTATSANENDNV